MPKKPNNRNELLAALVALTDEAQQFEAPEKGFRTIKQYEDDFSLGQKQTYLWMERLAKTGLAEKKTFRIRVGVYRREVPHYKLNKKADAIVSRLRSGQKPRGEA
jgi:hypothetical protein